MLKAFRLAAAAAATLTVGVCAATPAAAQGSACRPSAALTRIALPGKPFGVASSADGCWLFVALSHVAESTPSVAVLHQAGGGLELAGVAPAPDSPAGVALTHDGRTLVVTANSSVLFYDVAKLRAKPAQAVPLRLAFDDRVGAVYAAISPDDQTVFVSLERRAAVAMIDLPKALAGDKAAVLGDIPTAPTPVGLALSADGSRLFVTSEKARRTQNLPPSCNDPKAEQHSGPHGMLQVVDVAKAMAKPGEGTIGVMVAGCSPVRVVLSPNGKTAWVTARGDGELKAFDIAGIGGSGAPGAFHSVKVGVAPVGVAVRPDGAQVWVANSDRFGSPPQGKLSVLWLGDQAMVEELPSGPFPRELKFLPDGVTLAVTEFDGKSLALIETDRLKR
jgi:DNA-binding beta-propeller fold protein YncE